MKCSPISVRLRINSLLRYQISTATEASRSRGPKKKKKGHNGKQGRSDDNLVAVADRKNPKRAPASPSLFDEMLKKPCPYHRGPTKHNLEECTVLRRYYTGIAAKEDAEEPPKDNDTEGEGFPKVKNCLLIIGGHCGGINPYTIMARLGPGGLAHYETSSRLDPTARSFVQGNKTWRSSRILVG